MTDRVFLDTNVLAYAVADDMRKKLMADELLLHRPIVSVQVINEFVNVCQRKLRYSRAEAIIASRMAMRLCNVLPLEVADIEQAFLLFEPFRFSHWDALIVASALRAGCEVLYSEDMQHGLWVTPSLQILNPFAE